MNYNEFLKSKVLQEIVSGFDWEKLSEKLFPFQKAIAHFLRCKREMKGLTQTEVGKKLGYKNAQYISNWERGMCPFPIARIKDIAELYELNKDQFIKLIQTETKDYLRRQLFAKSK